MKTGTIECMVEWTAWMKKGFPKLETERQILKRKQIEYHNAWVEFMHPDEKTAK